ncbi:hypothetical protein LSAT2_017624 [Lamellibrachia satsuma]|nr:hypothetical protein LSAT2_017624 [Lamellibrachia satsuma]
MQAKKLIKSGLSQEHCTLRCLEVLYLWNSLSTCRHADLETMLEVCNQQTDKKLFHLRSLIEGALYRELGDTEMAIQCFREAIARQEGMKDDLYVAAYALYDLGSILMHTPQTWNEGSVFLHKAKDMSDYDFEGRLNIRIYAALKRDRPTDKTAQEVTP